MEVINQSIQKLDDNELESDDNTNNKYDPQEVQRFLILYQKGDLTILEELELHTILINNPRYWNNPINEGMKFMIDQLKNEIEENVKAESEKKAEEEIAKKKQPENWFRSYGTPNSTDIAKKNLSLDPGSSFKDTDMTDYFRQELERIKKETSILQIRHKVREVLDRIRGCRIYHPELWKYSPAEFGIVDVVLKNLYQGYGYDVDYFDALVKKRVIDKAESTTLNQPQPMNIKKIVSEDRNEDRDWDIGTLFDFDNDKGTTDQLQNENKNILSDVSVSDSSSLDADQQNIWDQATIDNFGFEEDYEKQPTILTRPVVYGPNEQVLVFQNSYDFKCSGYSLSYPEKERICKFLMDNGFYITDCLNDTRIYFITITVYKNETSYILTQTTKNIRYQNSDIWDFTQIPNNYSEYLWKIYVNQYIMTVYDDLLPHCLDGSFTIKIEVEHVTPKDFLVDAWKIISQNN